MNEGRNLPFVPIRLFNDFIYTQPEKKNKRIEINGMPMACIGILSNMNIQFLTNV